MISSQQLRQGNYFKDETGAIQKVLFIEAEGIVTGYGLVTATLGFGYASVTAPAKDQKITCPYESAQPIELTPEVLEKCGFESMGILKTRWGFRLKINEIKIHIEDDGKIDISEGDGYDKQSVTLPAKCLYLHDLQNLILLFTGKELEVNL